MTALDLKQIMLTYSLEEREIASVLFPDNKFPEIAFRRALEGTTKITVDQVASLSNYLGVPVYELFTDNGWCSLPDKTYLTLRKGDVTVVVRSNSITVRDKFTGKEHYIVRPECITLADLAELINEELAKDLL